MTAETALVLSPAIVGVLVFITPNRGVQYLIGNIGFLALIFLVMLQLSHFDTVHSLPFPDFLSMAVIVLDVLLLLYFLLEGARFRNSRVWLLATAQLLLYGYLETRIGDIQGDVLVVDAYSVLMFAIINIVGGIIALYAFGYMKGETEPPWRKRVFVGYLFVFMSIMNLLVISNSLLLFFFLFEMTTLASYLLIRFRGDEESRQNALRALWMNQLGGVVILLGTIVAVEVFGTYHFDRLLASDGNWVMLAIALLSMAAFVKGASIPFDSWLLGAMVAPTPVSAMLHSATMVKIAPFLILKLSAALVMTPLGILVSLSGAGIFVMASFLALSKTRLKEILGLSTIAMLGLMMSLIAVGHPVAIQVAMLLMVFHALSKAMLFLVAGNLERLYHLKEIEAMKGLIHQAPKSVALLLFGFMTMVLPPFGLFVGKLLALQVVAELLHDASWVIAVLLSVIIGGVLLSLLYFKIASALLSKPSDVEPAPSESIPFAMAWPVYLLGVLIVAASAGVMVVYSDYLTWQGAAVVAFFVAVPLFYRYVSRFDRASPYQCGEKASFDAALIYLSMPDRLRGLLYWAFGLLFVSLVVAGALS